jgi:RNA polymerase sigma-70 factor (ECF subfamily)
VARPTASNRRLNRDTHGSTRLADCFLVFRRRIAGRRGNKEGADVCATGPRFAVLPADRLWRERGLHRAVLAGDRQAWQIWYEESFTGLAAYVSWRCAGLRHWAEEVIQETWLTAVRRIRDFDPAQGSFAGWLRGIAANHLRKHFVGARKQLQRLDEHDQPVATNPDSDEREQAEAVAWTLAQLPARYEAVLRAKYLDQQSMAEIAASWQETPKAIESLLTRARQAFRDAYPGPAPVSCSPPEDKP